MLGFAKLGVQLVDSAQQLVISKEVRQVGKYFLPTRIVGRQEVVHGGSEWAMGRWIDGAPSRYPLDNTGMAR